ncbi:MAG TPA: hypothetical protein VMR81_08330 [Patescibacteria group bacterium]|nr:hypothetical protein [Patescibacteria group bacterium]
MVEGDIDSLIRQRRDAYESVPEIPLWYADYDTREPWGLRRMIAESSDVPFSRETRNIIVVPIQAEMENGNLYSFLRQLDEQKGVKGDIGVILLINENRNNVSYYFGNYGDEGLRHSPIPENIRTAEYLSLMQKQDYQGMSTMGIPDEYIQLAKQMNTNHTLEIRFDYVRVNNDQKHFGLLRRYLLDLANSFHAKDVPEDDCIIHLQDIDTILTAHHIYNVDKLFQDKRIHANISEWDIVPGVHEGYIEGKDASRDVLSSIEAYRAFKYAGEIATIINGTYSAGTPTMSARLSAFKHPEVVHALTVHGANEDYAVSEALERIFSGHMGHSGEVYRVDRARNTGDVGIKTDAVLRFQFIKQESFRTVNVIYPEVIRLAREARYDSQTNRILHAVIAERIEFNNRISSQHDKERLLRDDVDDVWETDPRYVRRFFGDELKLWREIVAQDIPEIMPLLDKADASGKIGSLLFLKKAMEYTMYWITQEYPIQFSSGRTGEFGSEREMEDFSRYLLRQLFYWKNFIRDIRTDFVIPEETTGYIAYTKTLISQEFLNGTPLDESLRYSQTYHKEEMLEKAKLRLRKQRVARAVESIATHHEIHENDRVFIEPFLQHFPEVVEFVRREYTHGVDASDITKSVLQYDFIYPSEEMSESIITLRAMKAFLLEHNLHID